MNMKLLLATVVVALYAMPAFGQSIYTGGEKGAYHTQFCPPLPEVLAKSQFRGYRCVSSKGTLDNIEKVLANPKDIGFVQLDVFAQQALSRPDDFKKLTIVRQLACEGVWLITKNDRIQNYGDVQGLARRLVFKLPPEASGSAATFSYLQSIDPSGLGRASKANIGYAKDATAVIEQVASSTAGDVGLFVQFADPENANIKLLAERGLRAIPVVSKELLDAKIGDTSPYQVQEFTLETGWFSGKKTVTACTPVTVITGNPGMMANANDKDNQNDMIRELQAVPEAALLPKDSRIAALIKGVSKLSDKALKEMTGLASAAKAKIEQMQ